ncbi:major facilitator superfamily permease [Candidatus Mancarchaeum acidiphilum]|uniref:Major facilitator superfamily permease n=1 Tax=Candidatus Mancarchaeum acidiphilum TaxID=1920749 RepID=A0A218NMS0_9ARCH|nr:MFS transporter [Candidatus Mancarchaeum acidiphilum]ASI13747.1 major facilitator superfamily permease [Candidatus Mancarchaeum acidiphilum]
MNKWTKLLPYWFLLFTIGFGWFILAPLVPVLSTSLGVGTASILLLVSMYGYTMVVLGLLAGWISAKFTVKTAIYVAAALSIIGLIGRSLFLTNYAGFLVFQIIAAAAYPLALAPVGSVADSIYKEHAHSIVGISVGILFFGLAIGAFFASSIAAAISTVGLLWFTAILAIIAAIWVVPGIKNYPTNYKGKSLKGVFKVGMIKNWWVGFSIASMSVMFGGIASTMLLHFHFALGEALTYGGLLGGLAFLGSALGAIILPPIFERYNQIRAGLISTSLLSLISVSLLAYSLGFGPNLGLLVAAFFLFGFFGNAFWSMALTSTTNYVSDPAQSGFATSMYSVITNLGVAFVPVFLGPEFAVDATIAVIVVFVIEFIAFILSPMLKTKNDAESQQPPKAAAAKAAAKA